MKRSLVAALLGVGVLGTAYGQGVIGFSNYQTQPYNQVVWNADPVLAGTPGQANQAVTAAAGLQFQLYYGEGVIADASLLSPGQIFQLTTNPGATAFDPGAGHGAGGFFLNIIQPLPTWAAGDTFTFMYRVVAGQKIGGSDVEGQSALWQQQDTIVPDGQAPNAMSTIPGLVVSVVPVPEPSSLALLGLGSMALLALRRRQ